MFKKGVVILVILCSVDFFTLAFIPEVVQKGADILAIGLIAALMVILLIYDHADSIPKNFILPIIMIFIAMAVSMFAAYAYQDQAISVTLWSQRAIYYYLFYFLLSRFRLHPEFIMKLITYFGAIYMAIYIVQNIVYPYELISYRLFSDRSTLRIFMPGAGYYQLGYYLCLYLFFKNHRISNLLYILCALVVTVLLGSRQLIASLVLITIIFLIFNRVVKAKAVLIPMMVVSLIPLYFLFQEVFNAMLELTGDQATNLNDNIRVRATKFFLTDFLQTPFSYVTGNGAEGNSLYGLRIQKYSLQYGFYQSDVGLIGDYTKYGILFIIGVFISLIKVFRAKLTGKNVFVKYFMLGVTLMLFTGSSAYANTANVVVLCLIFYFIDASIYLQDNQEKKEIDQIFLT